MKISGNGSIPGGSYNEEITISGNGKITGNVSCTDLKISGSGNASGDLTCSGHFSISGSGHVKGALTAQSASINGSGHIDGSVNVKGNLSANGSTHAGRIQCGVLTAAGDLNAQGDISAESAVINGAVKCSGLFNAGSLNVKMSGKCFADSIGGSEISIHDRKDAVKLISRLFRLSGNVFTVKNSIEGDEIDLENVEADTVTGRNVTIGPNCKIRRVIYSENLTVSDKATVESSEQSSNI